VARASNTPILDPVAAYDRFAPQYVSYAASCARYLRKIEDIVVSECRKGAFLLDIGSGDGSRALRIAGAINARRVVLVEPSTAMQAQCTVAGAQFLTCRAAELQQASGESDVITCLWNVLGHLHPLEERYQTLLRMKQLLRPGGAIFLDVIHRYNAAAYGWTKTALRILYDIAFPAEIHGDVVVRWNAGEKSILTRGHVFTQSELARLFHAAGLKIMRRWIIDYDKGEERQSPFQGHLLYRLERP
jgi:2-polyprenyl-3-methyl-5-hydroxy-6-metoxy-1,4-benzoquinol methylase